MCGKCRKPITVPQQEKSDSMKKLLSLAFVALLVGCAGKPKAEDPAKTADKASAQTETTKEAAKTEKPATASGAGTVVCSIKGDERTIEIKDKAPGCEVLYTKFGETKSIASAQNDMSYCEKTRDRITGNLTAAGFSCK